MRTPVSAVETKLFCVLQLMAIDRGVAALKEKRRLSRRKTGEFLAELGSDDAHELVRLVHRMNEIIEKNQGARLREILYSENPKPENGFCDTPTTKK